MVSFALCSLCCFFMTVYGFSPRSTHMVSTHLQMLVDSAMNLDQFVQQTPAEDKCRVVFKLKGTSLASALFRAELKKELTMFRGCPARFELYSSQKEAAIIAEGRTTPLKRFADDWLRTITLPASERKASFQGPLLEVQVTSAKWEPFKSELKGFAATVDPPPLDSAKSSPGTLDASTMAGTDESV
jgi:hypothetical protein